MLGREGLVVPSPSTGCSIPSPPSPFLSNSFKPRLHQHFLLARVLLVAAQAGGRWKRRSFLSLRQVRSQSLATTASSPAACSASTRPVCPLQSRFSGLQQAVVTPPLAHSLSPVAQAVCRPRLQISSASPIVRRQLATSFFSMSSIRSVSLRLTMQLHP